MVHALTSEAMRATPADRPRLLRELKNVVIRYFQPFEPAARA
jgi:hypothetical protein